MAATASPYGFKPVKTLGGTPYSGAFRQYGIASGYACNIYNGSIVYLVSGGTVQVVLTTGADYTTNAFGTSGVTGAIGIFVGCTYTNPGTGQKIFAQYWPTGTVASDAMAYVVDDDRMIFQVQAAGSLALTDMGSNLILSAVQSTTTGSTQFGNSNTAVSATSQTTTGAFRLVEFIDAPFSKMGDAYTDVLVKFNPGYHCFSQAVSL